MSTRVVAAARRGSNSGRADARATRAAGISLTVATAVLVLATTFLDVAVASTGHTTPVAFGWFATIPAAALAVAGAVILRRRPEHRLALVMLSFATITAVSGLGSAWVNASVTLWPGLQLVGMALVLNQRFSAFLLLGIVTVFVLFPDGRLPRSPLAQTVAIAGVGLGTLPVVVHLLMPWDAIARNSGRPDPRIAGYYEQPWGLPLDPVTWDVIAEVTQVAQYVAAAAAFVSILLRAHRADQGVRHQIRWVAWAAALVVLSIVLWPLVPYELGLAAMLITFVVLCGAISIATTRYRLASIDRVIGWTLLYVVLVIAVIVLDVVLLALAGSLLGEGTAAIVSAVIVLVAFAPLREPMLAAIQRLVYGRRGDPYGVVAGIADELERADTGDDQLEHIVRTVASAFGAEYVRIRVSQPDGGLFAEAVRGTAKGPTTHLPLTYRGESIGELELSQPRRVRLSRRDERLLADVVRQAAAAVRATLHSIELQRARAELVIAREAERRRLRRDVHDGMGPTLAAVKLRIDAARNLAATDPDGAAQILADASTLVTEAVGDIRRIVDGLRPPALDDVGLRGAIDRLCAPAGPEDVQVRLRYSVESALPAAVEVAALRIVAEALTNVRRHAGAAHVDVTVEIETGTLVVEVVDDGRGIAAGAASRNGSPSAPGVGLRSMRERAEELDGAFTVAARPGSGTIVRATLPLVGATAGVEGD